MRTIITFSTLFALLFTVTVSNATVHNVSLTDYMFSPNSFTAAVGDTVIWTMEGGIAHTTTSVSIPAGATAWDNQFSGVGQSFMYVIKDTGTYNYHCSFHYQMYGMVASFVVGMTAASVKPLPQEPPLLLIPNPFTGNLKINYDKAGAIMVSNMLGEMVALVSIETASKGKEINIPNLPKGEYMVMLMNNGVTVQTQMVMKAN